MNKAIILGNLTRDPELKALQSGTTITTFSVATNRTWVKDGQKQQEVEYHNCVAFGKQGETIAKWFTKGKPIVVEGRIQTRSWDGNDGKKNYRTEIVVNNFEFVSGGRDDQQSNLQNDPVTSPGADGEVINVDEIPW